ncbi:branched-chain amino acid ABC transporter permease [Pseudomonas sp. FW306-02-F02-AA]|uniref:Branched-chain amino acid ABC transporter permease n=1 Tax=Pseudomonas fluorescens TaxID=294 RepID=A0A0N9WSW2_PSEFL|nr:MULTISPECIES: AzlC family ABC transporter permease [Pseudomonas]ALI00963.1 branched-chain amino acid ABC transporter permease [Pseudomonas fluorescens]PMZ02729.1 branched-chain amino acid ABC transporter permease [Pseudomonas sp. FW306-02-F02-AB]PMZ09446.1 branched-chain amino acid ABC transporter permease [Pseudomonas sp. FW306-02-H06C]PMZ15028.1 branched-chain amino acid ABC transporter permease [Pseudomonas sp. FW306-02-F02-AA]PMZ23610.1 branched-chain amino acid ABC transporter permease
MSALNPGLHLSATTVLKEGLRDSITFGVAFIFLYVSIGILGATQSLSLSQTLATTLLIFSTPLQFLLMQSYQDGWILIPVILVLNARFALLSSTLAPHIRSTSTAKILASLILITPSTFTACITRFKRCTDHSFIYLIGIGLPIFSVSIACTYIGFATGANITSPAIHALMTILLPLQFTALAAKQWPHYYDVSSYWLGFMGAPLLIYPFGNYNLLITPFVIGGLVVLINNGRTALGASAQ